MGWGRFPTCPTCPAGKSGIAAGRVGDPPHYFGNGASAGLVPAASGLRAVFMIIER